MAKSKPQIIGQTTKATNLKQEKDSIEVFFEKVISIWRRSIEKHPIPWNVTKKPTKCFYCGGNWHTKEDCFIFVGYPEWWTDLKKRTQERDTIFMKTKGQRKEGNLGEAMSLWSKRQNPVWVSCKASVSVKVKAFMGLRIGFILNDEKIEKGREVKSLPLTKEK